MNITSIKETANPYAPIAAPVKKQSAPEQSASAQQSSPAWQKDILMQALDLLENNKQLDDSHPLDRAGSEPIETFEEAIIELSVMKPLLFNSQASDAQANLKPQDVLSLFVGEEIYPS